MYEIFGTQRRMRVHEIQYMYLEDCRRQPSYKVSLRAYSYLTSDYFRDTTLLPVELVLRHSGGSKDQRL